MYLVRWSDAVDIGSPGFGLLDELERRGLDVAADEFFHVQVTDHRARPRAEADAQIHLATGVVHRRLARRRRRRRGRHVRRADADESATSTPSSGSRSSQRLRQEGLDELVPQIDTNLFGISVDTRLSAADHADLARLVELGQPMAVFIAPPPADADPDAL